VTVDDFIAHFPDGLPIPPLLVKLADYCTRPGYILPGDLELTRKGRWQAIAWFNDDETAARPFVIFAIDKADSSFGYWRYADQPLDQAPLVYLDTEGGDESTVLANTFEEFLALLAIGNPAYTITMVEGEDTSEDDEGIARYRTWLREEIGIAAPTISEAHAIVERAQAAHPSLPAMVDRWLEERDAR